LSAFREIIPKWILNTYGRNGAIDLPLKARNMSGGHRVIKEDTPRKAGTLTNRIREYGFDH
jgi:hypothetical protein